MLYRHHAPHSLTDTEVKVTDIQFFCLMKCLYHISQSSESIHISNRVCFHSITTDPRVNAMSWGWRSKYKTSSYSSEFEFFFFFSSPEPLGSQGELIIYPYSGVRCRRRSRLCRRCLLRQQCFNIFSSETALPIKAKFYVEPPWEGGTKVYINGPGHMTKMATMPLYGKNL